MLAARTLIAAIFLVAAVATVPVYAADPQTKATGPSHQPFALSLDEVNRLPMVQVNVASGAAASALGA